MLYLLLGACHVKEYIDDYFMKVIAHLTFLGGFFYQKKMKNGTNETCILSIY